MHVGLNADCGPVDCRISFTASGGKPNELAKSMLADTPPGQPVVSMMGAEVDAEIGGASMAAAPGAARVKKKKKKRPTGAAGAVRHSQKAFDQNPPAVDRNAPP